MGVVTSFAIPGSMRLTSVIGEFEPEFKTLEEAAANPLQRTKRVKRLNRARNGCYPVRAVSASTRNGEPLHIAGPCFGIDSRAGRQVYADAF